MSKTYKLDAEEKSIYLSPIEADGKTGRKGERGSTRLMGGAKLIDIGRIKSDPNQPRKKFRQETLESLAESIKELGGIIDPLTVEYNEQEDLFRIISGERRYRAATLVGSLSKVAHLPRVDDNYRQPGSGKRTGCQKLVAAGRLKNCELRIDSAQFLYQRIDSLLIIGKCEVSFCGPIATSKLSLPTSTPTNTCVSMRSTSTRSCKTRALMPLQPFGLDGRRCSDPRSNMVLKDQISIGLLHHS